MRYATTFSFVGFKSQVSWTVLVVSAYRAHAAMSNAISVFFMIFILLLTVISAASDDASLLAVGELFDVALGNVVERDALRLS